MKYYLYTPDFLERIAFVNIKIAEKNIINNKTAIYIGTLSYKLDNKYISHLSHIRYIKKEYRKSDLKILKLKIKHYEK